MLPNLAMQMILVVARATVLLAFAAAFLYRMRSRSTAAGRHFVCATALAAVLFVPVMALVPLPHAVASWPAFHIAIGSSLASPYAARWTGWPRLVLLIWGAGAAIVAFRNLIGSLILWTKRRRFAHFEAPGWSSITLRTGNINSPVACGLFSPTILLPESARQWDAFRLRAVLLHELAHIRRHDCVWRQIAAWGCALFWFHPLVWRLAARLYQEQELACDDLVLAAGVEPRAYASLLLETAQAMPSRSLFACAFHGNSAAVQLRARFANILEPRCNRGARNWQKTFATGFGCLLLAMSSVTLARAEHIYRIGGDVISPKLINKVEPEYTPEAKAAKIQGTVLLSVVIGKNGLPRDIHVERSLNPGLDAKAVQAVKTWRFEPALRNGKPVAVRAKIEVNFRLL